MVVRFLIAASVVALVVAAGAQATAPHGTLSGVVMRGPIAPVCAAEQPCDAPAAGITLVFVRNGSVAGRAVTNSAGAYRLRLHAGWYSVRRAGPRAPVGRGLEPDRARVFAGRTSRVDFTIDTGIR